MSASLLWQVMQCFFVNHKSATHFLKCEEIMGISGHYVIISLLTFLLLLDKCGLPMTHTVFMLMLLNSGLSLQYRHGVWKHLSMF